MGNLTDAAEGATSSITKAIEDTSSQVTNSIDNTAKSVTSTIDNTAKRISGTAEDFNKRAESAADDANKAAEALKDNIDATAKNAADASNKAISDMKDKADEASTGIKSQVDKTKDDIQKTGKALTDSVKNSTEKAAAAAKETADKARSDADELADLVKGVAEAKAAQLKGAAEETAGQVKSTGESMKKEAENKFNEAKNKAEDATSQAKQAAEDAVAQAKSTGDSLKREAEDKAGKVRSSAESTIGSVQSNISNKAAAAKSQAEHARAEIEATALEAKKKAESTFADAKGNVEKKAEDLKSTSESIIGDAKNSAQGVADSINQSVTDTTGKITSEGESTKDSLSDVLDNTAGALKGAALNVTDTLKTTVTTAVGGAVNAAADVAKKTVTEVSGSVNKAAQGVTSSLTGAVHTVSGSVQEAAGAAVGGLLGKATSFTGALTQGAQDISKAANKFTIGNEERSTFTVCKEDEMKDGEMKVFKLCDEGSVLLVKEDGTFSALGTKCSHYGAPLAKGVLHNGKIRCPWHGACFNTKTGDIEESPGLDSIPCYEVLVEDGEVKVLASSDVLKNNMRIKPMCQKESSDCRTFVIIGGGGAGQACADTLRQEGFTGRLVVLCKELDLPYDRPKLSKALTSTGKDIALRSEEFFHSCEIEMLLDNEAVSLDTSNKTISCGDGSKICYDSLLIATGGSPILLDCPGSDLENVCYLRTPADANKISSEARDKNAVVIGTSFIGMEVAAYLHGKAKSVVVIGRSKTPFINVFGEIVGERLKQLFTDKGIKFELETEVEELLGENGKLKSVVLKNGETLDADICIVGIGVRPATGFLVDSGIKLSNRNLIEVDKHLKTSVDGVYAAGDIVQFPLLVFSGESANIGHWQMAQTHGRTAAFNMLGKTKPLHTVPFFWTAMFGKSLRYAGYGSGVDDFIIDGDVEAMKFVLYCCKGDKVAAVAAMGMDPVASQFASYVAEGGVLKKSEIQSNPNSWLSAMP